MSDRELPSRRESRGNQNTTDMYLYVPSQRRQPPALRKRSIREPDGTQQLREARIKYTRRSDDCESPVPGRPTCGCRGTRLTLRTPAAGFILATNALGAP